jgi:acyl-CoA thioesterase FadM
LAIAYQVERIGTTSVTNLFTMTNQHGIVVGRVRTVHVLIDAKTSAKKILSEKWRVALAHNM